MSLGKKIGSFWARHFDYDKVGEKKILKSIRLYHSRGALKNINKLRALFMWNHIRKHYNCCIYPGITVGKNFHIVHCNWVEIGKTAVIGDNCRVYSKAEVIAKVVGDDYSSKERRHARIGNDCLLGACCLIIGAVDIGDDCIIGAGAIVTKDVPAHSVVVGTNQIRAKRPDEIEEPYRAEMEESR